MRAICWGTLFLLLALGAAGIEGGEPRDKLPKEMSAKEITAEEARPTIFAPLTLPLKAGTVVELNKKEITIRLAGTGKNVTYPFHDALAAGGMHKGVSYWNGYRVRDVQVGDEVWLAICSEGEVKFCAEISIRQRPGGRVPESSDEGENPPTYAMMRNAENDFKDFGIPIPENCKPRIPGLKPKK